MERNIVLSLFQIVFLLSILRGFNSEMQTEITKIFDFNSGPDQTESWWEVSDTVREPGKSKASFILQKSRLFQRAIFFALINPQPSGAGFAGVKTNFTFELASSDSTEGLLLQLRAQGELKFWKVVLTNQEFSGQTALYTYEAKFQALQEDSDDFLTIRIPFTDFHAYYRGALVIDAPPLQLEKIGTFGLQTFGGVYDEYKQSGVGSLEIDFIAIY